MKKIIEINERTLTKLKIISAFEDLSVKALIEKAVVWFIDQKEKERLSVMTPEEKEDLGLLLLMQQADEKEIVSEDEFFDALRK